MKEKNRESMMREIHGMLPDGQRVFLGFVEMDYEQIEIFLEAVDGFVFAGKGAFRVGSRVYNIKGFIGVQVTPGWY